MPESDTRSGTAAMVACPTPGSASAGLAFDSPVSATTVGAGASLSAGDAAPLAREGVVAGRGGLAPPPVPP